MSDKLEEEGYVGDRAIAIIKEFNLPTLIAGPAGKALSKLVGAAIDIPVAAIENVSSRIRDDARSRSLITSAIAQQASELAAQDPELVQRSLYRWLGDNARKQANREKVAEAAAAEISAAGSDPTSEPLEPATDWMNHFSRLAEDASSEEVQKTWGRVLAGEIRKPGSFSLRTLRFISELGQATAELYDRTAKLVVNEDFLPGPSEAGNDLLLERVRLEDEGLIVGASSPFTRTFTAQSNPAFWREKQHVLAVHFIGEQRTFSMGGVILTGVAKEMLSLVTQDEEIAKLENMARAIDRSGIAKIEIIGPSGTRLVYPND